MKQKISSNLNKTLPFLKVVTKLSPTNRKKVLKEVGSDKIVYNSLHEIAHNTLKGRVKLDKKQQKKLKPYLKTLNHICKKPKCLKKQQNLIVQSGGAFPILIPAISALLTAVPEIVRAIKNKTE